MSNYQTFKNTLKKLESKKAETETYHHCGVITYDEYRKLDIPEQPPDCNKNRAGFLLVGRRLTEDEWVEEYNLKHVKTHITIRS